MLTLDNLDPKVLTAVEISALKVRVFGKKLQKPHAKPHANLKQKQQRTHDDFILVLFY